MSYHALQLSLLTGAATLLLLTWKDFRRHFRPYLNSCPVRAAMIFVVFSLINSVVYLLLCAFFLGLDPLEFLQAGEQMSKAAPDISAVMQPVVIAFMYFGTGALAVRVGKTEFQFYGKLLDYVGSLLPPPPEQPGPDTIEKALGQYQEYRSLKKKVDELRAMATTEQGWDALNGEWTASGIPSLSDQLDFLADILKRIDSVRDRDSVVEDLRGKLATDVEKLREEAQGFVCKFISKNGKTPEDVQKIFEKGLDYQGWRPPPAPGSRVRRAAVLSFVFGLAFGPIYAITRDDAASLPYALVGGVAVSAFGVVLGITVQKAGRSIVGYVLGGGIAGLFAQIVWNVASHYIFDMGFGNPFSLVFGLVIGISIAVSLYAFRFRLTRLLKDPKRVPWYFYACVMAVGAVILPLVVYFLSLPNPPDFEAGVAQALIGAMTLLGVAFGTDVFSGVREATEENA